MVSFTQVALIQCEHRKCPESLQIAADAEMFAFTEFSQKAAELFEAAGWSLVGRECPRCSHMSMFGLDSSKESDHDKYMECDYPDPVRGFDTMESSGKMVSVCGVVAKVYAYDRIEISGIEESSNVEG